MSSPTPSKSSRKVIITCAVTGAIHTPTMSPYLPITADEIAEAAIGAHKAGAAIVHLHARDPKDGRPDQSPAAFEPFLKKIKAACDVVINITTGGAPTMTVEERLKPCAHFKPEVASLNMGSMNFGLFRHEYQWSVLGAGRNQLPIAAQSVSLGGNVRVGLEDSLWIGPGKLAETNAQQVTAARQIIEGLGLEIATPDEAREMLKLKG